MGHLTIHLLVVVVGQLACVQSGALPDAHSEPSADQSESPVEEAGDSSPDADMELPKGRDLRPLPESAENADGSDDTQRGHGRALPDGARRDALLRSLLAGLSTSVGAAVVLLLREAPSTGQMAFALALAGGVMLTVSVVEMFLPQLEHSERWLESIAAGGTGAGAFAALRRLLPEPEYVHHKEDSDCEEFDSRGGASSSSLGRDRSRRRGSSPKDVEDCEMAVSKTMSNRDQPLGQQDKNWRLAVLLTVALTAHNFPEGLAVAVSSLSSDHLGLVVMAAIAMHNIPEGIAIAMPVLQATGSRWRAMQMATLSGLAEPLGAFVAVTALPTNAVQGRCMAALLCCIGGIMTSVALTELIPEALKEREPVHVTGGLLAGFVIMMLTHELA